MSPLRIRPLSGAPGCLVMIAVSVGLSVLLTIFVNIGRLAARRLQPPALPRVEAAGVPRPGVGPGRAPRIRLLVHVRMPASRTASRPSAMTAMTNVVGGGFFRARGTRIAPCEPSAPPAGRIRDGRSRLPACGGSVS